MDKTDRRVKRTEQLLGEALVSLILERGYDTLTIKDITERADVAHATFYRHYKDKDDLLTQLIEQVITEIDTLTQEAALRDAEGYIIFKHAQENNALYRVLFTSQGTSRVRRRVQDIIARNFYTNCAPLRNVKNALIPPEVAAHHMAGSILLLIEWWLENDMPHPPHHMAQIYQQLIIAATLNTVAASQKEPAINQL